MSGRPEPKDRPRGPGPRGSRGSAGGHASPAALRRFGTHPKGPADAVAPDGSSRPLQGLLEASPAIAGIPVEKGRTALPYLFKVLSVAKALSIQAHPDKKLAEELHAARPDVYRDDNHKPEMAIAVTPFEAMCGFRSLAEIASFLGKVPELRALVGEEAAAALEAAAREADGAGEAGKAALRAAFAALVHRPDDAVEAQAKALVARLTEAGEKEAPTSGLTAAPSAASLALRLNGQFPLDVGVFAPFLLNVIRLEPGQGVFLAANEPHAYLSGDCVECMACSDNVVRAGLTPKLKDKETLVRMLTYSAGVPPVDGGTALGAGLRRYAPPVPEFEILRAEVAPAAEAGGASDAAAAAGSVALPKVPSAAIVLVV